MTARIADVMNRHPLGRTIEHDERSRQFRVTRLAAPPHSAAYERHCPPYDQGDLGSCTGNAMAGTLMTDPFWRAGRVLTESDAVRLYSEATHVDDVRGVWPPDDTGSSGLGVAKAARRDGLIAGYEHAFGLDDLLHGLSQRPGILGISWYSSFDAPLPTGECPLDAEATIRGGHEIEMFRLDIEARRVWCYQSWGPSWGGLHDGTFWLSFDALTRLLAEQGDATFPVA